MKQQKETIDQESNILHAIVYGKVQGVGFRVFVRQAAQDLGCTGWVRNLPDGTVEVYAYSDSEITLTELLTELYKGPPWSHVSNIDVKWKNTETSGDHEDSHVHGFKIVR